MDSIINRVVDGSPSPHNTITFHQGGQQTRLDLRELDRLARRVALYLKRLGVGQGDRIGLISRNRLEWVLLDLAALKIKAVTAGFEAGKFGPPSELIARYNLRLIFTDQPADEEERIIPIDTLLSSVSDIPEAADLAPATYNNAEVTTIKFTSGSTGEPKGLAATVGSIDSSISAVQALFGHAASDKLFVFLPLSLLQQRYWIYSALVYGHDVVVTTYELSFRALQREQPTVIMGVPGFFETVRKAIEVRIASEPDRDRCGDEAKEMRRRCAASVLGPHVRYLWTGSAPASPDLLRFFCSCDIAIFEGYGMNETCIVTKNTPGAHRPGSVGQPIAGKHIALDADGVVIVKSDFPVNTRYLFSRPGESERIFMPDGTVRTGDLGRIDADGFLYILGRADDLVVLKNGRNVLVRPIEERLRACPHIVDCIVVGFGFSRLCAIVYASNIRTMRPGIEQHIATINRDVSDDEKIGGIVLADEPFTIENGLLTSQYKPRRKEIVSRYERKLTELTGARQ
ncbi:MAG: long-chain acyl-CoA synthetase [Bradyrhizobium sp.]|jgi:long-subunit acyl-CoA synthetase (AMP-forming)|nr:long-chain acyl-CoA synthetase [Bradyrhizobium sp.]